MAWIPEKGVFVAYIFMVSMLFLILSSSLLFEFGDNSLVPRSVNNTPEVDDHFESPPFALSSSTNYCNQNQALLKVFMYDLPPWFHFGLLGWKGDRIWPNVSEIIPKYPGGLNLQHSVEYWLTLDILSSSSSTGRPCTAIRVQNSSQADVILVPFFSSLSYNRHGRSSVDKILQEKLVRYLESRDEWRRFGGKDHLIMAHHPNSMLLARKHFGSCMLLLADFGRYPVQIANIHKDVIAPYKHVVPLLDANHSPSFFQRRLLLFFQGAIRRKDVSQDTAYRI